jgi:hypothetical protein
MKDQHTLIKGYRNLTQNEIDLMNRIKLKANECGELCAELFKSGANELSPPGMEGVTADSRWVAIGQTQLQQGFMALTRSVAKPDSF